MLGARSEASAFPSHPQNWPWWGWGYNPSRSGKSIPALQLVKSQVDSSVAQLTQGFTFSRKDLPSAFSPMKQPYLLPLAGQAWWPHFLTEWNSNPWAAQLPHYSISNVEEDVVLVQTASVMNKKWSWCTGQLGASREYNLQWLVVSKRIKNFICLWDSDHSDPE